MKSRLLALPICLMLIAVPTGSIRAEELNLKFLERLREESRFDAAIDYLDRVAQRSSLPETKPLIVLEKAITLREKAREQRAPEKQYETLEQALECLEQFAREYPDHPKFGEVNLERSQILLQKAEVEIFQSKSPSIKQAKEDFQRRGREFVKTARESLELALRQDTAAYAKFPAYIDDQKNPKLHAERATVETNILIESLNLAKCTYQEAQTYDSGSPEFKQLLNQAADEFEKVYIAHRTQLGGLHARAWQGKCYEEAGDLQKAMGIYGELLDHPGHDPGLQRLQSQTQLFKLICLNNRDDRQLAVDQAEEWLQKNESESKTSVGLGIQWEQARALEALGNSPNLPKPDQDRYWRQARTIAQQINRFPGEYKDVSLSMMKRIQMKLGGRERVPEDFETAYGLARQSFNQAQEIKRELDAVSKLPMHEEEIKRLKQDWNSELNDAAKNFELAMTLVNRRDNPKDVATSRFMQAYANFYLRRNYEAAILAGFVSRTTSDDDGTVAIDAAYMAMAAFVQAYNDNKVEPDKKLEDLRLVIKAAKLITDRWPQSEKSIEARMILGGMHMKAKKPLEAAEFFDKIPKNDPKFPDAQLLAGQAYWMACRAASQLAPDVQTAPEKLADWKASAEQHLRLGITRSSARLPKKGPVPPELVSAKIYLAEILLSQGNEADALKILLSDPQSVVKAVAVADEAQRPTIGVQSRPVAKTVYSLLVRAYIGIGPETRIEARCAFKTLEFIVSNDPDSDLAELQKLKAQLEEPGEK